MTKVFLMARKIKEIENTPVFSSNRVNFVKREWTDKEREIINKYTGKITQCPEPIEDVKLTYTQRLGKIKTKQQLMMLESYIQGATDAKEGVINIFDIDELTSLYEESYERIIGSKQEPNSDC